MISTMRCCCSAVAVWADCATAPNNWPMAARRLTCAGVGALGDLVPRRGLDLLGRRATLIGQLEKLFAASVSLARDQAFVVQQLQRRVDRPGAGPPDPVAALGDLLDHLVAVHRPLGQQRQDGRPHVAAASAAGAATTPSAAPSARAEAEARAEAGTESRPETGAEALVAGVVAKVFEEFPPGLTPGVVQGAPVEPGRGRSRIRSRAARRTGPSGGVNGLLMVGSPLKRFVGGAPVERASEYHDISETIAMQRDVPVGLAKRAPRGPDLRKAKSGPPRRRGLYSAGRG